MAENSEVQQIVERAVAQALKGQIPQLQAEVTRRVVDALPASSGAAPTPALDASALVREISSIHTGTTQKEILRGLLDAASAHCSRIALFVVKAGSATGWQSRGLGDDEVVKEFPLEMSAGPVAHAFENRVATPANIAEMDARFVEQFGGPANEQMLMLPLVLKDKVAALVYADGGENGNLDSPALELLVLATGAWLEVASLRKQVAQRESEVVAMPVGRASAPPVQTVSSFSDPFASHAPRHTAAEPASEVVEVASARASAAAAPAAAADPLAGLSADDADTHRKAQRFARLLVDEIKLYNQAKVAEGRRHKDLYDRLKADIEKSRGTYSKRYGGTVAANVDYFQQELVRSLAEDDVSIMGAHFKR